MPNFAAEVKKQIDNTFRQEKLKVQKAIIIGDGGDPIVQDPMAALNAHKVSGDHDERYYTETEIDGKLNFLTLTDTPDAYTDQGSKIVAVKADVSGLEFVAAPPAENGVPVGGTENQLAAKNSDLDYDIKWVNAPEAANGLPAGGGIGQLLKKKTITDFDSEWIDPPAVGLERWIIPTGTNLGYDDEFNDGSINEDWVAVDVSGYANSWYEPSGIKGMSGYFPGGKGSMKLCGMVRPFADLTHPLYIETAIKQIGRDQQYPAVGLVFADGSTGGAGNQVIFVATQWSYYVHSSKWTNFTSRISYQEHARHAGSVSDRIYLRLAWSAANTFKFYYSMDGVVWIEPFAATLYTITPTHFGICQTSFDNSSYPYTGNFGYFRARSGNSANG